MEARSRGFGLGMGFSTYCACGLACDNHRLTDESINDYHMLMPRNPAQNAEIRQESRRQLVEAATRVFTRMGYAGARMAEIAREAGLSHGLAFHYFANKEAMFVAVVEATMGYAIDMARAAVAGNEPAICKLRQLCSQMLDGARHNPSNTVIMFQTSSSAAVPQQAKEVLRRASYDIAAAMAQLISEAQSAGDLNIGDPGMLARTLLSTLSRLALSVVAEPQSSAFPSVEVVMRLVSPKGQCVGAEAQALPG